MFTKKIVFLVLILAVIPFAWYSLRPTLVGYDSYHYLNLVCGKEQGLERETPGMQLVMPFIPCDVLTIKWIMAFCYFASLLALLFIAQLFHKKNSWMAIIFVSLGLIFLRSFTLFENEVFAFPLILWGTYFFLMDPHWKKQAMSFALFLTAACFWLPSWLMLVVLAIPLFKKHLPLALVSAYLLIMHFGRHIHTLLPNQAVKENSIVYSIPSLFLLPLGMLGLSKHKQLLAPGFIFLLIALLNPKYAFFAVPFLAIGLVEVTKIHEIVKMFLISLALMLAVFAPAVLLAQEPTTDTLNAIDYAVQQSKGQELQNDWGIGYIILNRGGTTHNISGGTHSFAYKGIILTRKANLPCPVLQEYNKHPAGAWKVYNCDI